MKYSVLMSVYKNDNPAFLKNALESIYEKQTRKPDEIVVVFDGELSSELYNVLAEFRKNKKEFVFYYPLQDNHGLGYALKIGSEKCSGDYIFRMDADDISVANRFEKQIEYIESHPDVDVLGTDISEFIESPENEKMRKRVCPIKHDDILKMAKRRNPMNHVSVCMKRASLEKCGGYKTLLLLEDYYLWLRMLASGCRFQNMNESLVYVRVGDGFVKRRGQKKQISGWYQLQKFMLKHKMVTKIHALINMISIVGFIYCPAGIKKFIYDIFLRKRESHTDIPSVHSDKKLSATSELLCPNCKTGMESYKLDEREPICPYMEYLTNTGCAKFIPLNTEDTV